MAKYVKGIVPDDIRDIPEFLDRELKAIEDAQNTEITTDKTFVLQTPSGGFGNTYIGGHYRFFSGNNNFSSAVNFGSANVAYADHIMLVLGEVAVDDITITVTGTRIQDTGIRTPSYVSTITIPNGSAVNSYFETPEKFIGQVSIVVTAGTPKQCNYGGCKYWDYANRNFRINDFDITLLAGANDNGFDIRLIKHTDTGWTYNAGSTPSQNNVLHDLQTDYNTEYQLSNGEEAAYKKTNLSDFIAGESSEGIIWEVVTTSNNAVVFGTIIMGIVNESD